MKSSAQKVVIVPEDEWYEIQTRLRIAERLDDMLLYAYERENWRKVSAAAAKYLDPERAADEGHLAYCFQQAYRDLRDEAAR